MTGELGYVAAHAALGCVSSAALGTGCGGGAIGGAASAAFSPDFLKEIDPTGVALDSGQRAALAGFSTLLGGGLGSLAGVNASGAGTAAQNEALNNDGGSADHTAEAVQDGGAFTKSGNEILDWAKWTYAHPFDDTVRGIKYFLSAGNRNGQDPQADPNRQIDPTSGPKNGGPSAPAPVTPLAALGCMFSGGVGCLTSVLLGAAPVSAPPPSNWSLSSGNSDGSSGSGTSGQGATDNTSGSSFTDKYLDGSGGRWGNSDTRQLNYDVGQTLVKDGYRITGGGGIASEEYIPGSGPGSTGGSYVDITAKSPDGNTVRVQTVTTGSDGLTPTRSEQAAATRIQSAYPNDTLVLIPKGSSQAQINQAIQKALQR